MPLEPIHVDELPPTLKTSEHDTPYRDTNGDTWHAYFDDCGNRYERRTGLDGIQWFAVIHDDGQEEK